MSKGTFKSRTILIIIILCWMPGYAFSQLNPASPANWLYPDGNAQGTRYVTMKSLKQNIDSFIVKWSSPSICGDVKPLIGNIISNKKLSKDFPYAPNEIAAVMGDGIVFIDATGKAHKKAIMPPYVKGISVLFDSLAALIDDYISAPVILGLETIEVENLRDSLAYAYIAGFDKRADTIAILKRLAIDLREFKPNVFASIKPVLGRKEGNNFQVYATVNMSHPKIDTTFIGKNQFFRGFAQFNTGNVISSFPLPDIGDDTNSRVILGPEVNFSQPSFSYVGTNIANILLPTYPSTSIKIPVENRIIDTTYPNIPYLLGLDITGPGIFYGVYPQPLSNIIDSGSSRPQIRAYYVNTYNEETSDDYFILVAEEYSGIDNSHGISKLHLYDMKGNSITSPLDNIIAPPFLGGENHFWSVAVGNVDGNTTNKWLPYYKNHTGNEIIVTQSTREFAYASSKLFVLRYYSGNLIEKPSPPNSHLFDFDTIVSQRINGWVAAVNDIDNATDSKDEILLVDGSKLMALRLREYNSYEFRIGRPFDTVFTCNFPNQTISSVAVSDLEGDGLNDIIVTTYDSIYVIGSLLTGTLNILTPKIQETPPHEYCIGDTVEIKWANLIRGQDKVNIFFEKYLNGNPSGDTVIIEKNFNNEGDSITYNYIISSSLLGNEGRFIIQSVNNPTKIFDFTAILHFNSPAIHLNNLNKYVYYVGGNVDISGSSSCIKSVIVELSYSSSTFRVLSDSLAMNPDGTFRTSVEMPCAPFFGCLSSDMDSIINIRIIGINGIFRDTANIISLRLLPERFQVLFDTMQAACPTKTFKWIPASIANSCDSVTLSLSADGGKSYTYIATVPANLGEYLWQIPSGLPESVLIRFCCMNSCVRTDTVLTNYQPKYIDNVSPNPFNPEKEILEIIYKVPSETNVTIKIFDQNNRIVAEPLSNQNRLPGVIYCDHWNGDFNNGRMPSNGMYYISLEFSNGSKEIYNVFIRK